MQRPGIFADYDDDKVFAKSEKRALDEETRNFVVEFGKDKAEIAFDLGDIEINSLLDSPRVPGLPVRWM